MHWNVRYRENSRTWFGRFCGTGLSLTEVALKATSRAEAELECEALAKRAAAGARVVRQADEQPAAVSQIVKIECSAFLKDERWWGRYQLPDSEPVELALEVDTKELAQNKIQAFATHAVEEWMRAVVVSKSRQLGFSDAKFQAMVSLAADGIASGVTPTITPGSLKIEMEDEPRTESEATYVSDRWQSVDENGNTADDNIRAEIAAIRKAMTTGQRSRVKDEAQGALNMIEHRLLPGGRKNGPTEVPIWYLNSHEERLPGFARSWAPRGDTRVSVRLEGKSECFLAQPHQVIPREVADQAVMSESRQHNYVYEAVTGIRCCRNCLVVERGSGKGWLTADGRDLVTEPECRAKVAGAKS